MKHCFLSVIIFLCYLKIGYAQSEVGSPPTLPNINYHLTSRPWQPLNISRNIYLDRVEAIVREVVKFQDSTGAIIDPYANREVQYATPYFANAVATLLSAGRANDLLNNGVAAMNKSTTDVSEGASSIPDNHGDFFLAPLASAIPLYTPFVSAEQLQTWKIRMAKPLNDIFRGLPHNWRTYAMKGEWYRAKNGYISKTTAVNWINNTWNSTQKNRFINNSWNFYHDFSGDPDSWPYESVARSNLLAMIADGYDGGSRNEILTILKKGTQSSLLMQDPSGQISAGGRSGNHTWGDILMANGYEIMAEQAFKEGNIRLAGQYRHAAALGFQSVQRWRRLDGTYSVTKNHFNPADRIGYAPYSFFTNYNGNMMYHMAENYLRNKTNITEEPTPSEIGGYTIVTDTGFATAVANAGGMHMQVGLRGASVINQSRYWSTLGVVRFARPGWDSRLGPSDGTRETSKYGVSFAPTFLENGNWLRLASLPDRYEAFFTTQFTHPLLVRCRVEYKPKIGKTGPSFTNDFIITPDGILSTLTSSTTNFGVTWPILTFDGATSLNTSMTSHLASASFPGKTDQQNFIALHSSPVITATDIVRRSSYGDLRPVRMVSGSTANVTFIYPRSGSDPSADTVRKSFISSGNDFSTILARVKGDIYIGRTSAGGVGTSIDIDNDSTADATFNISTGFVMQLNSGEITRIETDRDVTAVIYGQTVTVQAYTPVNIDKPSSDSTVTASADDGNIATNTIDKNYATRWAAFGNNQWIRYRLNTEATIKTVKIAWYKGNVRRSSFDLQTSLDGINWETVFSGNSSGTTTLLEAKDISPTSARYVQIVGHGNNLNLWNSITEVEIVKDSAYLNISTVTASADDGNIASNTIDKKYTTRWAANGNNQWIRYQLDTEAIIKSVKIAWYKGNERRASFDLQTSLDGINWVTIFSGNSSGATTLHESYNISPTSARYVQIMGHGNNLNLWNSITEVEILKDSVNTVNQIASLNAELQTGQPAPGIRADVAGNSDLKIWPNPGAGIFNVKISASWLGAELVIYDVTGKIILRKVINKTTVQLNLSNLPNGVNILALSKKDKVIYRKIMLLH